MGSNQSTVKKLDRIYSETDLFNSVICSSEFATVICVHYLINTGMIVQL